MSVSIPSHEIPLAEPRIMSAFRKFGRYDDFKPVNSSISSIGSKSIGKLHIDCQFQFKKSKWGTLHGHPGGIIYLNLNFGPPSGCRVSNATVTITLDGHDPCLRPYIATRTREEPYFPQIPVRMTEWYGPQCMGGEKKSAEYEFTTKAVPEANVLGYSVGGIGHEKSKTLKKQARWSFNGQLLPGERMSRSVYTSLRWYLNENELEGQSFHNPEFQTAFAFEHSGQPFIMKVKIEGKLAKRHHQIKSKLAFDGAKDGKVVTLVDFQDHRRFLHGLDKIAQDLGLTMEMKNLHQIPIEIPGSIPGTTFQQVPSGTPQQPSDPTSEPSAGNETIGTSQAFWGKSSGLPMLQSSEQSPQTGRWTPGMRQGEGPPPGAEDYRTILAALSQRPTQRPLDGDPSYTATINTSTLVGAGNASEKLNRAHEASTTAQTNLDENTGTRINDLSLEVDHNVMLRILSIIPGMLTILQLLASMLGPWRSGNSMNGPKIASTIHQVDANSQGTTLESTATTESRKARVDEGPEES